MMALDGAAPVSLAAVGGNFFKGAIEVQGAAMNGPHTVLITALGAGRADTWPASFEVDAPDPGENIWVRTSDVPNSQTRAIAVDPESNVYDVGTVGTGAAARLAVSKRDEFGTLAWPGAWATYNDERSWGEDIAVGPDGLIYVLGNYEDAAKHVRWWLLTLDPGVGIVVDEQVGEIDQPAHGMSISPKGDLAIVTTVTVWNVQLQKDDPQTQVIIRPKDLLGVIVPWGYSPPALDWLFTEVPEDVLIDGERVFVTGSVEGKQPDIKNDDMIRKRVFVIEVNFQGEVVREYVA
ncbi:MAG TPA: hypothetical protein VGB85_02555, partial [Nannocystis sp.]